MEKPNYLSSEKVTCLACYLWGAMVSLVSFPCVPIYVAAAV
jgi:hypothetical protein